MFCLDRMTELVEKSELTPEDFCLKTDISANTYQRIIAGLSVPNCRDIVRFANTLNTTTDYLLGMDMPHTPPLPDEDSLDDNFRIRFNRLLMDSEVTLESISELTGRKLSAITAWKKGAQVPDGNSVIVMAALFGCTTDYLLGASMERKASK